MNLYDIQDREATAADRDDAYEFAHRVTAPQIDEIMVTELRRQHPTASDNALLHAAMLRIADSDEEIERLELEVSRLRRLAGVES